MLSVLHNEVYIHSLSDSFEWKYIYVGIYFAQEFWSVW